MKLNYHPPHLMLVHFPAALFPIEFAFAVIALYKQEPTFSYAAFYALGAGVIMGWLAVIFGFIDLVRIPDERGDVRVKALIHGSVNTLMLTGYSVLFFMQWKLPEITYASTKLLLLKAFLLLILIAGNYLGAQLVLKYKVGTISDPENSQPESHA
jgi:uncharacterized membrane protein